MASRGTCPVSGSRGRPVTPITVRSLVVESRRAEADRRSWYFCDAPSCAIVYFADDGARLLAGDLRVRVGLKETEAPRPLCYCFGHSVEEIEAEVAASGTSQIAESIKQRCRQGLDRCEETNPQGSCCLGNVSRAIREAQARATGGRGRASGG